MAEYIEREKAKEELLSWSVCINHPEHLLREDAMCVIDSIPAADVEVVKHGRWVNWQPKIALAEYSYDTKACSKCGYAMANALRIPAYYCPNCGCKMDLEVTNGLD